MAGGERPTGRRTRRLILGLLGVVAGLVLGAEVALRVNDLPGVVRSVRLATSDPSASPGLFESRLIPAADSPRPWPRSADELPATVPWQGTDVAIGTFLDDTGTNALLLVRDGVVVGEWYRSGFDEETLLPSFSMAKSVVSLLMGREIAAGRLAEDDLLVDVVPRLRTGGEYDRITVEDLLDMRSGVDVSEIYTNPTSPVARMYATTDLDGFLLDHRQLFASPGGTFDYRSVDTALLGLILEEFTGRRLADLVADHLWGPFGAESDATWSLDRRDGQEKAFCCLNATARDFARIGQLVLDGGRVDGVEVIDRGWIDRITERRVEVGGGWGYSAQWWHRPGGVIAASGIYGQAILVDPAENTVVVKLSDGSLDIDAAAVFDTLDALVEG